MAVKKRDVVLMGKNAAGDQTIDMPITRLGNIEDSAEIKENPTSEDYIPVIDMADGGQMKKTPYAVSAGGSESDGHRYYETDFTLTGDSGNIVIKINLLADIFTMTVNGKSRRVAQGRMKIVSYTVNKNCTKTYAVLSPSGTTGMSKYKVPVIWGGSTDGNLVNLNVFISELTDGDVPFVFANSEIYSANQLQKASALYATGAYFPFWLEA